MGDKEAVVVILDVGTPMGASLAKARAAVFEIVMQKLLYKVRLAARAAGVHVVPCDARN